MIPEGATHRWETEYYKAVKGMLFIWWIDEWCKSNNSLEDMEKKNFDNHGKPKRTKKFVEIKYAGM